jgi:hypothetical protein
MKPEIQFTALYRLCGEYLPKESVESYLDKHPDVKKLYYEYEAEILKENETYSEPNQ